MISSNDDTLHQSAGAVGEHVRTRPAGRQRSARTDPSMRDGDSSHGNPYETDPGEYGTDFDVGDAVPEAVGPVDSIPLGAGDPEGRSVRSVHLPNTEAAVVPTADMTSTGAARAVADELDDGDEAAAAAEEATGGWNHAAAAEADHEDRSDENNRAIRAEPRPDRRGTREPARASGNGRHNPRRAEERPIRPADPALPIEGYRDLTVPQILDQVFKMPISQAREVQRYEGSHLRRKTLLVKLERYLRDKRDDGSPIARR